MLLQRMRLLRNHRKFPCSYCPPCPQTSITKILIKPQKYWCSFKLVSGRSFISLTFTWDVYRRVATDWLYNCIYWCRFIFRWLLSAVRVPISRVRQFISSFHTVVYLSHVRVVFVFVTLSLCVEGSSRRSVVIWLCLYVDVCFRVVTCASHC